MSRCPTAAINTHRRPSRNQPLRISVGGDGGEEVPVRSSGTAEDVWLDVLESEPVLVQNLNELCEPIVIESALSGGGGVEVHHVDYALGAGILSGRGPHGVGQVFTETCSLVGDGRPACVLGQVEPHKVVVLSGDLGGCLSIPELFAESDDLIVEDIRQALLENEREDVVLEFRGIERTPDLARSVP